MSEELNDKEIHPELVDLQDLIFNPTMDAGIELHKRISKILAERDAARSTPKQGALDDVFKGIAANGETCHFGTERGAVIWAGTGGTVERIVLRNLSLIASPQAKAAAMRTPLTKAEIDFILTDSFIAANGSVYSTRIYDFVDAIDAALRAPPPSVEPGWVSDAARDVLAERARQISVEGWTPEHDDEHNEGVLAHAGACYARWAFEGKQMLDWVPTEWPWADEWWKAGDPRRNLIKATSLILAEVERLDRAAAPKEPKP